MLQLHGVAFSGGSGVQGVEVSVDGGRTWWQAPFFGPYLGRHAWRQFAIPVRLERGSHVVASRAIGHNGWRDHAVSVKIV